MEPFRFPPPQKNFSLLSLAWHIAALFSLSPMHSAFRAAIAFAALTIVLQYTTPDLCAQTNVNLPADGQQTAYNSRGPIEALATHRDVWKDGETTITALRGGRDSQGLAAAWQGDVELRAESLVLVDTLTNGTHNVQVYAEGRVRFKGPGQQLSAAVHSVTLRSPLQPDVRTAYESNDVAKPTNLMRKAISHLDPSRSTTVSQVGFQQQPDLFIPPQIQPTPNAPAGATRRIQIRPRSSTPLRFEAGPSRDTTPVERVYIITGGVNVVVEGLMTDIGGRLIQPGVLDLSADRVVVWSKEGLESDQVITQPESADFQIYLEGNILVRQGLNTITASHAFVDVSSDRALLLNADLRVKLQANGGQVRVRAEKLRQLSENKFQAQNAWTTTSPYGKPGYRIQSRSISVAPGPISPFTQLDPYTGQPKNGPPLWITAEEPQFMIGDVPILKLPRIVAPAEDPNIPIRRAAIKHDRIFGLQVKTVWDLTKVLGQPKQRGMQWDLLADYLSDRGPAIGVEGEYDVRNGNGRMIGNSSIIYQYDDGSDNLGFDRKSVSPGQHHRGQVIWRHKQERPDGLTVFGEIGLLSDRNYRESFHEADYDSDKDIETILGVRQDSEEWSGRIFANTELNEFESSTDWLPKADLFGFSQPLFGGLAYWSSHSSAGYADLEPGAPPADLTTDPYALNASPYFQDSSGLVAMTRHQIDAPFMLGPVNFRPYAMGEAAFWNEGLQQQDLDRFLFNGGVEAHLSATKIMPFVQSEVWNLNGLVHKSDLYLNYSYTDVSQDLDQISQYNAFDDNSTERFRHRFTDQIFGGLVPNEFDPRNYAIRTGAGLWTSAPYHELVDDQEVMRLRWRNRLQTKVGPQGSQRIRDWMVWEYGASYFPQADRDNFGENFGLLYANWRWNVSDRTSILSNAVFDLFENSQDVWSVGVLSQRSLRGSTYVGFRQVEATNYVDSQTLVASYSYQMSPKWISTGSIAYDVAAGESRGSSLTFSRIGLDWILHFGFGIDTSKDNVGIAFSLEPRFGPPTPTNLSYLLGLDR